MSADQHRRPDGVSDQTVVAVGQTTEALEWVERARGSLYDFHQEMGRADALFGEAADSLERAGHLEQASELRTRIVGRNAIDGRWSFQIVEEFDVCTGRRCATPNVGSATTSLPAGAMSSSRR